MLDIGCGTGEATNSLAQRLPNIKEICAVDRSREFIDLAKEVNTDPDIHYRCMNAEDEWPSKWNQKFTMVCFVISCSIMFMDRYIMIISFC